jgi:CO/xanthine dehydrogenase Mo-binding subunit
MSFLNSRQQAAPQGIGKPVRRREDARFLTGAGEYADDWNLPDIGVGAGWYHPRGMTEICPAEPELIGSGL